MNIQIRPLHNRVLVKVISSSEPRTSPGGILLPDSAKESPIVIGTIVAAGEGVYDHGMFITPKATVGDKVIFGHYAGANIDEPMGFEDFMIVRDTDILAIIIAETDHSEKVEEKMSSSGSDFRWTAINRG